MSLPGGQLATGSARASRLDLYAVGLSTMCLLHCLALPLLAVLLPFAAGMSENPYIHRALVLLAAPATLWIAWTSLPVSSSLPFLLTAFSGLGLLLIAAFVDAVATYEQPMTAAGALLLAFAHLRRWARHRRSASRYGEPPAA
ncbi:MAG: MerC family mercury resistance protein [Pseudomonadota bacterium]|nr:MerC family mercury resistance protein [Pseudomonadota bacterium]